MVIAIADVIRGLNAIMINASANAIIIKRIINVMERLVRAKNAKNARRVTKNKSLFF